MNQAERTKDTTSNARIHLTSQPPGTPKVMNLIETTLITRSTRSLLILSQAHQQLPKLCLLTSGRTTLRALSTQVDQLANALPACATSSRILSVLKELLGITSRLGNGFLLLCVVVLVEVVNALLGSLDGLVLLLLGAGLSFLDLQIAAFAPLLDDLGFFFVVGAWCVVAGLEGDGAAWCYALITQMKSVILLPP
jgi:hypothetical protein